MKCSCKDEIHGRAKREGLVSVGKEEQNRIPKVITQRYCIVTTAFTFTEESTRSGETITSMIIANNFFIRASP